MNACARILTVLPLALVLSCPGLCWGELPGLDLHAVAMEDSTGQLILQAVEPVSTGNRLEYRNDPVTEWYVHRADGVEQGFTLAAAADGSKTLSKSITLRMRFGNNLTVRIDSAGERAAFYERTTGDLAYRYEGLKAWDGHGRPVPARLATRRGCPDSLAIILDSAGAVFPICVDPIIYGPGTHLGGGVSVSLSGNVVLIGAPYGGHWGSDVACVYDRNGEYLDLWGKVHLLYPSLAPPAGTFGTSVSVAGDVALVGSDNGAHLYERDAGGTNSWGEVCRLAGSGSGPVSVWGDVAVVGSASNALVYERDAGGTNAWGRVGELVLTNGCGSLSLWGDVALVGSASNAYVFERNAGAPNAWGRVAGLAVASTCQSVTVWGDVAVVGSASNACVFERNSGGTNSWGLVTKLKVSGGGRSVSVAGDVAVVWSGSGTTFAFERNLGGTNAWGLLRTLPMSGSVSCDGDVVAGSDGNIMQVLGKSRFFDQTRRLTAPAPGLDDGCGSAVSVAGDVAIVGAPWADGDVAGSGEAYVFERNVAGTNRWGLVATLTTGEGKTNAAFGSSVSVAGDVAVIGAPSAGTVAGDASGAAYVFARNSGGTNAWGRVQKLAADDAAANDHFGSSVSMAGDTAIVGAPDAGSHAGVAYLFDRNAGGANAWGQVSKLTAADGATNDLFGCAVAVAGNRALVGAPGAGLSQGAAYVFERNSGGTNAWGQVYRLVAAEGAADDHFGNAVALGGDVALVGAPAADAFRGAAYVMESRPSDGGYASGCWLETRRLTAGDGVAGDRFGSAVSFAGEEALVGAPGAASWSGRAYVFERCAGGVMGRGWTQSWVLAASDASAGDRFGGAVALAGDTALVGADGRNRAYVFESHHYVNCTPNADFDGDGKEDLGVLRPSTMTWYAHRTTMGPMQAAYGMPGDLPEPADYDGDGLTDIAVVRPSTMTWYIHRTSAEPMQGVYGARGDIPIPADFDGDGKADLAVVRPSTMTWYIQRTSLGPMQVAYGGQGDIPIPADYDGDGKADFAVLRPSTMTWYIYRSSLGPIQVAYGGQGDIPIPADFDGDGKADFAVLRPSTMTWYIFGSSVGPITPFAYGARGDVPLK